MRSQLKGKQRLGWNAVARVRYNDAPRMAERPRRRSELRTYPVQACTSYGFSGKCVNLPYTVTNKDGTTATFYNLQCGKLEMLLAGCKGPSPHTERKAILFFLPIMFFLSLPSPLHYHPGVTQEMSPPTSLKN